MLMADGVVETVTEAFRAELSVPACGPDDSFFQLGGDSFQAARVLARLNERHAVRIPFVEIYRDSRPVSIARVIEGLRAAAPASRRSITARAMRRRRSWFPLALGQDDLYKMNRLTRGAGLFNNVGVLWFTGDIDPDALRSAVGDTVGRQSALRLVFGAERGSPVQGFAPGPPDVQTCDLRGPGTAALWRRVRKERLTGFDLHAGPPVRFVLARVSDDTWALVSTVHHIIFDGMSQALFVDDLAHAYAAELGAAARPRPLRTDYIDFALWQHDTLRGDRLAAHLDAIKAALSGEPAPRLALARPGARARPSNSFMVRARRFSITRDHARGLRAFAASCDTTLFVVLVAALLDFLARRTGDPRPAVAIQAANRAVEGTEAVVGCFASSVCVAVDRTDSPDPAELVRRTKASVAEALRHQELPLESAVRMLKERDGGGADRLPQVGFTLRPARVIGREIPGGELTGGFRGELGDTVDPTAFPLVLELFTEDGALDGVTHHRLADWPDETFVEAEAELAAAFAAFAAPGRNGRNGRNGRPAPSEKR
jgi:Condensation domain/Phosphopantetheine attachment site